MKTTMMIMMRTIAKTRKTMMLILIQILPLRGLFDDNSTSSINEQDHLKIYLFSSPTQSDFQLKTEVNCI